MRTSQINAAAEQLVWSRSIAALSSWGLIEESLPAIQIQMLLEQGARIMIIDYDVNRVKDTEMEGVGATYTQIIQYLWIEEQTWCGLKLS
ncbi:hypothetical protein HAX54_015692 [Datura stramonium]|uniref:Uncharacterized protein n=1 Tax=Datura stramonium TaxID=4076 RepID=A0ABS8TTQ4_DATST|nr:hypothetical protein [Datura stramonium]